MREVRIGFIGCGPRARDLMQTCMTLNELKITALCDKVEQQLSTAVNLIEAPAIRTFLDHQEMLRAADIDAVYVVVEPENCAELVVQSLEAGKHVISEVPMAFTIEDCWRIIRAVEKTGLIYLLGEQLRHAAHIEHWKKMADAGRLGKIVYAEGEYLHGMGDDRYYLHPTTGDRITIKQASKLPNSRKSRAWNLKHPILYLPHELSPLLRVMDDRVVSVTCTSTATPSRAREFYPFPDFEAALMQTEMGNLINVRCGFTVHTIRRASLGYHWHRIIGTGGTVETNRSDADRMKWLKDDLHVGKPEELVWDYDLVDTSLEARNSGHGGTDYYPIRNFVDAVLYNKTLEFDVYRAAETAAPAILAALSAEQGSERIQVPDFRVSS